MRSPGALGTPGLLLLLRLATDGSATAAAGDRCAVRPVSLPISNTTLSDGAAVNRGVEVQIGNQPVVGCRISVAVNNTRIRNRRDCQRLRNLTAESGCEGASGSSIDLDGSDTWQASFQGEWNVSIVDATDPDETVLYGYEVARFRGLPEIPRFPIAVWSKSNSTRRTLLGLGPQSSFLTTLWDLSLIPSKTFGLFFGSRSQTRGVDGSLIIGGDDQARIGGEWVDIPMTPPQDRISSTCPLQVRLKDVRLNNDRGSFSLFVDPGATVAACIDPSQNVFAFTPAMYDRFANLTEHPSTRPDLFVNEPPFSPYTFPTDKEPLIGNLTITLSNGFETVIPHYEPVSQERGTSPDGKYAVVNESRIMTPVGAEPNEAGESFPILGGVYLSQVYLFVDYDRQMFRLAPAVPGEMAADAADIRPLCRTVADQSTSQSPDGPDCPDAGAIAGGVGGGAVVLALLSLAYVFRQRWRPLFRRREITSNGPPILGT